MMALLEFQMGDVPPAQALRAPSTLDYAGRTGLERLETKASCISTCSHDLARTYPKFTKKFLARSPTGSVTRRPGVAVCNRTLRF